MKASYTIMGGPPPKTGLKRAAALANSRTGGIALILAAAASSSAAAFMLTTRFITGQGPSMEQAAALAMGGAGLYAIGNAAAHWSRHPDIPGLKPGPSAAMALLDGGAAVLFLTGTWWGTVGAALLAGMSIWPLYALLRDHLPEGSTGPASVSAHRAIAGTRITIGHPMPGSATLLLQPRHQLDPTPSGLCHLEQHLLNNEDTDTDEARRVWTEITGVEFPPRDCPRCNSRHRHALHREVLVADGHPPYDTKTN